MHKYLDHNWHSLMNSINYMSSGFPDCRFLGFLPIHPDDNDFGINIKNQSYTAVYLSNKPIRVLRSDYESEELAQIQSGKSWLMVFYGIDNTSYMRRFHSEERALKWFAKATCYKHVHTDLYYNS